MNLLDYLRPVQVGPKMDVRAVLRWRAHQQQLWRTKEYQTEKTPFVPIKINQSVVSHTTPVSAKDKVIVYGVFGVVLYLNREFNDVCVRHFDVKPYRDETYDLDLFEAIPGRIRWRIE